MKIGDRVRVKELEDGKGMIVDYDSDLGFKVLFDRDDKYNDAYYTIDELVVDNVIINKIENMKKFHEKTDALEILKEDLLKETYNCIKAKLYIKYGG